MVCPIMTTSSTVTGKFQSMVSNWGTYPILGRFWLTSIPLTLIDPPYNLVEPKIVLSNVVLPDPVGPIVPRNLPTLS